MAEIQDIRWGEDGYQIIVTIDNGLKVFVSGDTIFTQRDGVVVRKVDNATLNDFANEIEFARK